MKRSSLFGPELGAVVREEGSDPVYFHENSLDREVVDKIGAKIYLDRMLPSMLEKGKLHTYEIASQMGGESMPLQFAVAVIEDEDEYAKLGRHFQIICQKQKYDTSQNEAAHQIQQYDGESFFILAINMTLNEERLITNGLRVLKQPREDRGTLGGYRRAFPDQDIPTELLQNDLEKKRMQGPWDVIAPFSLSGHEVNAAGVLSYLTLIEEARQQNVSRFITSLGVDDYGALLEMGLKFSFVRATDDEEDMRRYFCVIDVAATDTDEMREAASSWLSKYENNIGRTKLRTLSELAGLDPSIVVPLNRPEIERDERYFLSGEKLKLLEAEMMARFRELHPDETGVVVIMTGPDSPYANIARTTETLVFQGYDSSVAMRPYDDYSTFLFTVNLDKTVTDSGSHIAHIKRLVVGRKMSSLIDGLDGTGIEVIDDRLHAQDENERCSLWDILGHHRIKDPSRVMNVTSNMANIGVRPSKENPYALISYKAIFEIVSRNGITHLFAYQNRHARESLGRLGVNAELLAGREFHLPKPDAPREYDNEYVALCMPYTEENVAAFTRKDSRYRMRDLIADRQVKIFEL